MASWSEGTVRRRPPADWNRGLRRKQTFDTSILDFRPQERWANRTLLCKPDPQSVYFARAALAKESRRVAKSFFSRAGIKLPEWEPRLDWFMNSRDHRAPRQHGFSGKSTSPSKEMQSMIEVYTWSQSCTLGWSTRSQNALSLTTYC